MAQPGHKKTFTGEVHRTKLHVRFEIIAVGVSRDLVHFTHRIRCRMRTESGGKHEPVRIERELPVEHVVPRPDLYLVPLLLHLRPGPPHRRRHVAHVPLRDARPGPARPASGGRAGRETLKRGGLLIIPAFAVGRTQDIVYHLHGLFESNDLPAVPVYVDSPLATNVTEIFRLHPECYDEETHQHMLHDHHREPFGFARLVYVRDAEDSKRLNDLKEPAIIISASGMCEAGRVLHHLRHHIDDPRTTVLFVGYQAQNTLGRKLVEGEKRVRIYGEECAVNARIETIDGYSAHADESELLEFIGAIPQRPGHVFIVHGEPEATQAMSAGLRGLGIPNVTVPERGQTFEIG